MIPKLIFRYSSIHDHKSQQHLETLYRAYKDKSIKKNLEEYPSRGETENYIEKIRIVWNRDEKGILRAISRLTGLKWQEDCIIVYFVGYLTSPYSDPVTIRPYKNKNDFVDILTHALIHQIEHQNSGFFKKWLKYMDKEYNHEERGTKKHLLLHSVHKKILTELGGESRLRRILKRGVGEEYKRAMQIVDTEGSENILKKFRKIVKS